jgi:peptide/nickel transport system substrate-binding protein
VFGVFFNQNIAPVFVYSEVRQALNVAVDRNEIINTVLGGYAQPIYGPTPPRTVLDTSMASTSDISQEQRIINAQNILTKAGWKKNASGLFEKKDKKGTVVLSFSISTGDAPELKATAELLQKQWQKIGALVSVKIFEISDLNQNIIRPRKYDALLFGEIVSRDLDLYPFWHSSERIDPGLNIALYTNITVDKILENLRKTNDDGARQKLYASLDTELTKDTPVVFIYAPYFIYVTPKKIQNLTLGELNTSSERLSNIYEWYIETNNVWQIFTNKNNSN